MTVPVEIPLFPLGTVLFPGGPLPLRIFETRYVDLVSRCLRDGSGFGAVLIREGMEAGGPALTYDVGTYARIVDFSQQPDGLLGIRATGERRFRILARRRARGRSPGRAGFAAVVDAPGLVPEQIQLRPTDSSSI